MAKIEHGPVSAEVIKTQTELAKNGWILRHPTRPDQFDPSAGQSPEATGWRKIGDLFYLTGCALSEFAGGPPEKGHFEDQEHFNNAVEKAKSLIGTIPS